MHYEALDPHLNLFRRFGLPPGSQEYENNVTHALINALRVSDPRIARTVITELAPEIQPIPIDWSDIAWSLQRPPPRLPAAFQNSMDFGNIYRWLYAADRPDSDPRRSDYGT